MASTLNLLPQPQKVAFNGGVLDLIGGGRIALDSPHPQELLFTARQLQVALETATGKSWSIAGSAAGQVLLTLDTAIAQAE